MKSESDSELNRKPDSEPNREPDRERTAPLLWLMGAIIVALTWALVFYARDEWNLAQDREEEEIETPSRLVEEDGRAALKIPLAAQKTSGIVTAPLAAATWRAEIKLYGSVIDLAPLIELRARYLAAQADAVIARSALNVSEKEYRRIAALYADDRNASQRALQAALGTWRADQARQAAAKTAIDGALTALRTQWGDVLAEWATTPDSRSFAALLKRDDAIVQIAIPFDVALPEQGAAIMVAPLAASDGERPAQFISPSPNVDSTVLGRTFFYRTDARDLRYGARVVARPDAGDDSEQGVLVPFPAVVWHGGKSWVYVQAEAERFERREVDAQRELDQGWFSPRLKTGDAIVISGAQLLLSEELKYQIRNENED
ncbi:MAG: hypothetical protein ACR2FI_08740 [Burkholderiales bacterium]|nr:hypothetical protein [Burkholderiales bacterium]MDQ3195007.1 hypothetical protein [Pseudomonadota bacterium]